MSTAISLRGVSKAYQLGSFNTGSFSNDLKRWWALRRGKEDPFLKIGEENDRTVKSKSNIVWSLKDLDFDIHQGETVGVIGRNGAGKSTLLKILSQVTHPTKGKIRITGKVASLLEVGTGFHPELTGRENVYLNGAILGMSKKEISRKFDEIVAFSGVEKYIDTPVKRYSSGMYVRLAFAVAAHLESEILIVDEVLAVGDADFQKKCLGKMNEIGDLTGRSILFVSHNMSSIKALCNKSIFLEKGQVQSIGPTPETIAKYLSAYSPKQAKNGYLKEGLSLNGTGEMRFSRFMPCSSQGESRQEFYFGEAISFIVEVDVCQGIPDVSVGVYIMSIYGETISMLTPENNYQPISLTASKYRFKIQLKEVLMPGEYSFNLSLSRFNSGSNIDFQESVSTIRILKESNQKELDYPWATVHGYLKPKSEWVIEPIY